MKGTDLGMQNTHTMLCTARWKVSVMGGGGREEGGQWQDGSRGSDGIIVPSEGPDKIYTLHLHPYIRRGVGRKHALSPACGSADWYYDRTESYATTYVSAV